MTQKHKYKDKFYLAFAFIVLINAAYHLAVVSRRQVHERDVIRPQEYTIIFGTHSSSDYSYDVILGTNLHATKDCQLLLGRIDIGAFHDLVNYLPLGTDISNVYFGPERVIEDHCNWERGTIHKQFLVAISPYLNQAKNL